MKVKLTIKETLDTFKTISNLKRCLQHENLQRYREQDIRKFIKKAIRKQKLKSDCIRHQTNVCNCA